MDSHTSNLRTSTRKAKKKMFDDFIPTEMLSMAAGKRKSNDTESAGVAAKLLKKEESDNILDSEHKIAVNDDNVQCSTLVCVSGEEVRENEEATVRSEFKDVDITSAENTLNGVFKEQKYSELSSFKNTLRKNNLQKKIVKPKKITSEKETTKLLNSSTKSTAKLKQKINYKKIQRRDYDVTTQVAKEDTDKHVCRKSGCGKKALSCCIKATNSCMEASGKSARWYHMSLEEHYCNGCFDQFYRVKNYACDRLHDWKKLWMQNSRADPNFKIIATYIAERQLPYWVQCTLCGHWRSLTNEVNLTPTIVKSYTCLMGNMANTSGSEKEESGYVYRRAPHIKYSCSKPNEKCVEAALDPNSNWMTMLHYVPFLKNSPAAPFLTGYYPDGVGMSAVDTENARKLSEFSCDDPSNDDVIRPPEIMAKITAKKSGSEIHDSSKITDPSDHSTMMTSPGGRKRAYKEVAVPVEGLNPYFQPFYKPYERGKALCMRPDVMELDEAEEFPGYYKDQTVYLAIRNLIISLWTFNPCEVLTTFKCSQHLLLRGLTRVRLCSIDLPAILCFATRKGLVNLGAIKRPISKPLKGTDIAHFGTLPPKYSKQKVIVVGTGPAGLGAARQLHNFGCDVVCLEARDRIGGRVHDDWSLDGVCVGKGAQVINGCVNNPLALISHQLGLKMHALRPRCDLFDGSREGKGRRGSPTKAVSSQYDKRMDFHFNALLDIIVEWRQAQAMDALDCSLGEKILEAHKEWMKQSGLSFSELEERLLNFHIGNLEFACGASLTQVSAFHWDQNEIFSQFSGDHTFVQYGFSTLLSALAHDLDIKFNSPVSDVTLLDEEVRVKTEGGEEYTADRVLVAVPLAVLRSGSIGFEPILPASKQKAMDRLGCGCIEKVALNFAHRFWAKKIDGANYFGYVPSTPDKKGFFSVFYDVPYPQCEKSTVLMSVISGEAVEQSRRMTDDEVVKIALSILRDIFPEEKVPQPRDYFVTRWRDDRFAQMAYSFVKKGSSGDDYDEVAKEIDERIFFAGEGTNRHFPQTVTGAYLSGIREASKIVNCNKLRYETDHSEEPGLANVDE